MSELAVLDSTGDTRIQWDKVNAQETAAAEARFNELRAKNWPAFRVNKRGDKGEQIDVFDPSAERILFVPPLVGG